MGSRCTCSSPSSWEYGPCDYCMSDYCHDCEHENGDCPDDCFCDCNDNIEEDDDA